MATKLATKEATITKTESLVLMKNMMRISISSICYARDLFPKSCFKGKPYGNMEIHQLQGATREDDGEILVTHPDAFLLTQWLEQGVFQALELEYLSTVTFAIYSSHPITGEDMLLETYEFKVSYQGEQSAKINDVSLVSKEAVKNHAAKFIRSLTEFSGTLDSLPDTCWITLQLKYNDHTPTDFEPEYFTASNGSVSAAADRLPLIINIGNLHTPCVDMKLKFAGLESLLFDDLCKVTPKANMRADTPKQPSIFQGTKCGITEDMQRMAVSPYTTQNSPPPTPPTDAAAKNETLSESLASVANVTPMIELSPEDKIKAVIMDGCGGGLKGLQTCAKKTSLPMDVVKKIIEDLLKKGTVKRKGRGYMIAASTDTAMVVAEETQSALPTESEAPPVPALVQNGLNGVQHVLMTPQDIDAAGTSTRCMQVPSAPRKVPQHIKPLQDSPMTDDIEETFQDATDSPKEHRNKPTNYHPQSLQLQRGKGSDANLHVASNKTTTTMRTSSVEEKEESYDHMCSITAHKRTIQMAQEAISLSQDSILSEVSVTSAPRKRLRKCSEIKDLIRLTELQSVARANQQLQQ